MTDDTDDTSDVQAVLDDWDEPLPLSVITERSLKRLDDRLDRLIERMKLAKEHRA